jgi:hypothetical protein
VTETPSAVVDGVDVDAVHDAVVACPGVGAMGSGQFGGATTYLPGRRINGLRVLDDAVEVEVRMLLTSTRGPTAADLAMQIRAAVNPHVAGKRVDVTITDVMVPADLNDRESDPPTTARNEAS